MQGISLGACCTCEFLQRKAAKIPDFVAPLGVCKVKIVQKARFLSLKCTKCDRLLVELEKRYIRQPLRPVSMNSLEQ